MTKAINDIRLAVPATGGRTLDVMVSGPAGGLVLVLHSGTPAGLVAFGAMTDAASARGLGMVRYARPGYSGSTPQPGRRVADAVADVVAILDHLGVERFVTAGWSGGGPHALACAAALPGRCLAAATIACVAPYASPGLDWPAGMGRENIEEFEAAAAGERALTEFLGPAAAQLGRITGAQVAAGLGELLSPVDAETASGDFGDYLAASFREAVRCGIAGWRDDDLAIVGDWGLGAGAGQVPVAIWQGGQDRMVPGSHGEWLAEHVPGARRRMLPGHGHLTLVTTAFGQILDDLIGLAAPVTGAGPSLQAGFGLSDPAPARLPAIRRAVRP